NQAPVQVNMPYLTAQQGSTQLQILPITSDNTLTAAEQDKTIVVRGQYVGKTLEQNQKIVLQVNDHNIEAKLESEGVFTVAIPAQQLIQSPAHIISAVLMQDDQALQQTPHAYQVNDQLTSTQNLDVDIQPLAVVDGNSSDMVEVSGKV